MMKSGKLPAILISFVLILQNACVPKERLEYFSVDEGQNPRTYINKRAEKRIQAYDKLYIQVYSLDEKVSNLFNIRSGVNIELDLLSYTVNDSGYIDFPFIGRINVQGLTLTEAKYMVESQLNQYLNDVSVLVRFVGNNISVLGEVNRQGEYQFFDDKINVLEAISLAGGISQFGDKSRVSLVREVNDEINYYKIDLTTKSLVESPFYYLQPNDIIVVEPIRAKYRSYRDLGVISFALGAISTTLGAISTILLLLEYTNN